MRQWVLIRVQRNQFLRTLAEVAENFVAPRQPVGVLGVIVNRDGHVLVAHHATRPHEPWGLPGGWLSTGEVPEEGILREVAEELDTPVVLERYVGAHEHDYGRFRPHGLTLVYRLASTLTDHDEVLPRSWEVIRTRWVSVEEACGMAPQSSTRIREAVGAVLA